MNCPSCETEMTNGIATGQTWGGEPEYPGDTVYTQYPSGPGYVQPCLKCPECGHSVTK